MRTHKTLQSKMFVCSYAHSFPHLFREKPHYINKAGDSRATRTLVHFIQEGKLEGATPQMVKAVTELVSKARNARDFVKSATGKFCFRETTTIHML